ncbi:hypothetical protein L2E82_13751 [Cichorium intybus]|uniref:Uncharacterized protein n=1 Tax=Cichorium intybus TaxID=13427 RepID=A0ACB9EXS1_CICIN|nr:hypothetical protein L2E82_13751 [Cichorium intybus]
MTVFLCNVFALFGVFCFREYSCRHAKITPTSAPARHFLSFNTLEFPNLLKCLMNFSFFLRIPVSGNWLTSKEKSPVDPAIEKGKDQTLNACEMCPRWDRRGREE